MTALMGRLLLWTCAWLVDDLDTTPAPRWTPAEVQWLHRAEGPACWTLDDLLTPSTTR